MSLIAPDSQILAKTQELCTVLLQSAEFQALRRDVDAFLGDESAKTLYREVVEKGEALQHRQEAGEVLADEEVAAFESTRERLFKNQRARGFLDAQQTIHKLQETVSQYVGKTLELGRVPTSEDFPSGSCGPSCGCDH